MKKCYLFLCILLDILAVVIIPLNLHFIFLPEFVSIILSLAAAAVFMAFWRKSSKRAGGAALGIITLFCAGISLFGTYCNPYWNSISYRNQPDYYTDVDKVSVREAKEDLDYAIKYLKKLHPALKDGMPEELEKQYETVLSDLEQMEEIDACTLGREIESVLSLLGDGHTFVRAHEREKHYYMYIEKHRQLGHILKQVNGVDLEELFRQKSALYSYDVESWGMNQLKNDVYTLEGLKYLGIPTQDGVAYTYEDEWGVSEAVTVIHEESDFVTYEEYKAYNRLEEAEEQPFVWYEIMEAENLALLTLDSCEYNDKYCACLQQMFSEMKEKNISNVAVDLRNNGGGSSMVANEFIRYLDVETYQGPTSRWRLGCFNLSSSNGICGNEKYEELLFHGNVYILTSVNTFSSAMMFAEYIKDNRLGKIVGEPCGNTPSGYGDIAVFKLPNSQCYMQISTKEFFRAQKGCVYELVEPDIKCSSGEALEVLREYLAE